MTAIEWDAPGLFGSCIRRVRLAWYVTSKDGHDETSENDHIRE